MVDMESWWEALDYRDQAAWLPSWEAGHVDPELVETLPPGRSASYIAFHPDLDAFLKDQYDARVVDE